MPDLRRIVTTHDATGASVLHSDTTVAMPKLPGANALGAVVWTTGTVPADNVGDMVGSDRDAGTSLKSGSVFRVTEFGPGFVSPMHRTHSIDYVVVLSGEIDLMLDGDAGLRLGPGDTVVQRGTNHVWRNSSADTPCRIMVVMIEALPVRVGNRPLPHTPMWRMLASLLRMKLGGLHRDAGKSALLALPSPTSATGIGIAVTGHDVDGRAIILEEDEIRFQPVPQRATSEATLWYTRDVPADNGDTGTDSVAGPDIAILAMFGGSLFRIVELEPRHSSPVERAISIDYVAVLNGRLEISLDGGQIATLSAGDTLVQRGTRQGWHNPDTEISCRIAVCRIEGLHR